MGNRTVITTKEGFENNSLGIYLHWNGGRDSVEAFLKYCELKGYRSPSEDNYGWARLCQVIGNFFGGSLSVGIDVVSNLDCNNGDNGTYIINGWKIVDRKYFEGRTEQTNYDMDDMLMEIDIAMPESEQIGEYLKAKEIPTSEVKVGDTVLIMDYNGKVLKCHVMGFGKDEFRNGMNVNGVPYVDLYGDYFSCDKNINNYICTKTVKVVEADTGDCVKE